MNCPPPRWVVSLERYGGQKQKWFALRFLGSDSAVQIATERPESTAGNGCAPPIWWTASCPSNARFTFRFNDFREISS